MSFLSQREIHIIHLTKSKTHLFLLLLLAMFIFAALPSSFIQNVFAAPTVGTISSSIMNNDALYYPQGIEQFWSSASGRYWTFWGDGANIYYSSSTDGSTWATPVSIATAGTQNRFCVWYDSAADKVHYVREDPATSQSIYYRMGTPQSSGSISWAATEQTVVHVTGSKYTYYPTIAVDSNGYPWIAYNYWAGSGGGNARVHKSSTKNGIWTDDTGFPVTITTSNNEFITALVPLTGGKMMCISCSSNEANVYADLYNGGWGGSTTIGTNCNNYYSMTAVANGDVVVIVWTSSGLNSFYYNKYSGSWLGASSFETSNIDFHSCPKLEIDTTNNKVYCFWTKSSNKNIWKDTYDFSTWTSNGVWYTEANNLQTDNIPDIQGFYNVQNSQMALVYMINNYAPFKMQFLMEATTTPKTILYSITQVSPANGSSVSNRTVNFTFIPIWTGVSTYIENATLYVGGNAVANGTPTNSTTNTLQYTLPTYSTYQWYVRLYNSTAYIQSSTWSVTVLPPSVSITITSSPAGSGYVTVDGSPITTPQTYSWNPGDSHTIAANSPTNTVSGQSQYVWTSWSDSGAQSHSYVVPSSDATVTGYFQLQYYLTVTGGNNPTPSAWYNSGATTTRSTNWVWNTVSGQSRSALTNWQLDGTNQNPARSNTGNLTTSMITMSTYHTVNFVSTTQYYLTLGTGISGSTVSQSGSQTSDNWYDSGSSSTIMATTPYTNGTTNRFLFQKWTWSRGGAPQTDSTSNPYVITMNSYVSAMANWIYDKIELYDKYIPWTRVDVGSSKTISLKYRWQSDNSAVASGWIVQVNGTLYAITSAWTNFTAVYSTVGNRIWQLTWANGGSNFLNSITPQLIWDALEVDGYSIDMANCKVYAHVKYAFDSSQVNGGMISLAGRSANTNSTGWAVFDLSTGSDFSWSQTAYGLQDGTYGITYKAQNQTLPIAKKTHLVQSDAQISSLTWDGVKLTVDFSGPPGSYTLMVSGSQPTYVMNTPYDLSTGYMSYLTLSHDGSQQIVVSYATWGDFYVRSLSQCWMTDIYWMGQKLMMTFNGTSKNTSALTVFCGSRGMPNIITGLTSTQYSTITKILSGTYQFSSSITATFDWTPALHGGSGGGGGGATGSVQFLISNLVLSIPQGQTINGVIAFNWTGENDLTITGVKFLNAPAGWTVQLAESLPKSVTKQIGDSSGSGSIAVRITAPNGAQIGDYSLTTEIDATGPGGNVASNGYINISVVPAPSSLPSPVSDLMTFFFVLILGIFVAYVYFFRR